VSVRAFVAGLRDVITAPVVVLGVTLATLASAVPFGLVLGMQLQSSLATRQPVYLGTADIDAEWWLEFREQADGLAATFTPSIIGFAAPLDNLSALLDGSPRPLALLGPIAFAGLLWAWLWGGLLERFYRQRRMRPGEFWHAGRRHFLRFVSISAGAAVVQLILFLTIHRVLFGPVFESLSGRMASERDAFFLRVVFYLAFGMLLVGVSLIADYARISIVTLKVMTVGEAVRTATQFLRRHFTGAAALYVLTGSLFVAALAVYGAAEIYGGTRLGGWRSVLIGQAYITARLVIRLLFAASEMQYFRRLSAGGQAESSARV
jgi:hypothetical protein